MHAVETLQKRCITKYKIIINNLKREYWENDILGSGLLLQVSEAWVHAKFTNIRYKLSHCDHSPTILSCLREVFLFMIFLAFLLFLLYCWAIVVGGLWVVLLFVVCFFIISSFRFRGVPNPVWTLVDDSKYKNFIQLSHDLLIPVLCFLKVRGEWTPVANVARRFCKQLQILARPLSRLK